MEDKIQNGQAQGDKNVQGACENADTAKSAPPKENMKARTITGLVYVAVLLLLLFFKWWFPVYGSIGFDLLFWAISVIGAYEFMRAVGCISKIQWWTAMITCAAIVPSFAITKMVAEALGSPIASEYSLMVLLSVCSVGAMVTAAMLVFDFERSSLPSTAYSILCILYCGALSCVGSNLNHMATNSLPAITLLVSLTAGVDTFALLTGKLLGKKLPLKLAPHTSPNKTVIGSVGGIIGGFVAATFVWLLCEFLPGFTLDYSGRVHTLLLLILISIPSSIFAQLGDLFESAIKRGCKIKDMGNILPGHGGILDRFDSTLFASIAIIVCFIMVR
ncbi:MAG: phosphatidate cytidylyltransferase [Candidatus Coproplasma sp.]